MATRPRARAGSAVLHHTPARALGDCGWLGEGGGGGSGDGGGGGGGEGDGGGGGGGGGVMLSCLASAQSSRLFSHTACSHPPEGQTILSGSNIRSFFRSGTSCIPTSRSCRG